MYKGHSWYIIKDLKIQEEWKRKLDRWAKRKETENNVETVNKVVDKWNLS